MIEGSSIYLSTNCSPWQVEYSIVQNNKYEDLYI